MGVDVETYRSRIGCSRQNSGHDVVHFTVPLNFTRAIKWLCIFPLLVFVLLLFIYQDVLFYKGTCDLNILDLSRSCSVFTGFHLCLPRKEKSACLKCPGAVVFIGLLLIIAGIETNPGPPPQKDETQKKITHSTERCYQHEERNQRPDSPTASNTQEESGACSNASTQNSVFIGTSYAMGVDVETYRSRIGCGRQISGHDVVHFTVPLNFTRTIKWLCVLPLLLFVLLLFINQNALFGKGMYDLDFLDLSRSCSVFAGFHLCIAKEKKLSCLKSNGAVVFIGLLLIIAGIETNPGPLPINGKTSKANVADNAEASLVVADAAYKNRGTTYTGEPFSRTEQSLKTVELNKLLPLQFSVGLVNIKETGTTGTGFLVGSDGHLMTACHVIKEQLEIILNEITYFVKMLKKNDFIRWRRKHVGLEELKPQAAVKHYYEKSRQKDLEGLVNTFEEYMTQEEYRDLTEVLQRKWNSNVTVKFGKPNETKVEYKFSPDIPFLDEAIDVVILKLRTDDPGFHIPEGLNLIDADFDYRTVYIFGYVKSERGIELALDAQCEVYTDSSALAEDVRGAINWWKRKEQEEDDKRNGKYKKINFEEEYKNCVIQDGQILLHASPSFVHGTSGSPIIAFKEIGNNTRHPEVVGIYLRGFPMFYYKIKKALENGDQLTDNFRDLNKFRDLVENNEREKFIKMRFFIEGGTTMKNVDDNLSNLRFYDLRNMLFPNTTRDGQRQVFREEDNGEQFKNKTESSDTTHDAAENLDKGSKTSMKRHSETSDDEYFDVQEEISDDIFVAKVNLNTDTSNDEYFDAQEEISDDVLVVIEKCNTVASDSKDKQREDTLYDCSMQSSIDCSSDSPWPTVARIPTGILEQNSFLIRRKLGLEKYFPCKITLRDVMKMSTDEEGNIDIAWRLLQELIMVNFDARDSCPYDLYKQELGQSSDDYTDSSDEDSDDYNKMNKKGKNIQKCNKDILKNQDIFITIFNCCDHSLKQVLVSKMILCRLAVPLIYPTFQSGLWCFSLWPFRCISLDFKEMKHTASSLAKYPYKVVSFVRVSRPNFSKSHLLNAVISNHQTQIHSTFYDKDCHLGTNKRELTNGLVEASWYIPGGQDTCSNVFKDMIMFTNLRGDADEHEDQMKSLVDMSNCIVVIVDWSDIKKHFELLNSLKKQLKSLIMFLTGKKFRSALTEYENLFNGCKVITLHKRKEEKNISALRIEMQQNISEQLQNTNDSNLEACASRALNHGIKNDELFDNCKLSKADANKLSEEMEKFAATDAKKKLLPLQEMWKDISKETKDLRRSNTSKLKAVPCDDGNTSTFWKKEQNKQNIDTLRSKQCRLIGDAHSLANKFIEVLTTQINNSEFVKYFLEWIRFYFDERSYMVLPKLMDDYQNCWETYNQSKQQDQENSFKKQMHIKEQNLLDASIGLEHILREMGQIYECSVYSEKGVSEAFCKLPIIAANLLILGYPLELMDGDAGNLPTVWIKSVFDACLTLIGDKKVFVISILGVQSSGKSTFLNSLFGLQFAVSAGRCTRGVFLQMMPVDSSHGLPIDYILVVDTEGLRAPELSFQDNDHDNELATLAIGVADMSIINIKGENASEMKDILEIVIHALLRLKLANATLNFDTSCTFVHQNVSASNAASKMKLGRQKLLELLDDVTREAALEVGIKDTHAFHQVINFDIKKDVWYLPDLWNGEPPMAHISLGYSKKVANFKKAILKQIESYAFTPRCLTMVNAHICDLWNGILTEDFVFSFRNSIEVKAYNIMENEYRKYKWALQEFQMQWMVKNVNIIGYHECETKFEQDFRTKFDILFKELECFFDDNLYMQELLKWKEIQLITFRTFSLNQNKKTKLELKEMRRHKHLQEQSGKMIETHLKEITEKAKHLAKSLQGIKPSETTVEGQFQDMWDNWLSQFSTASDTVSESVLSQITDTLNEHITQLQVQISKEINDQILGNAVSNLTDFPFILENKVHYHIRRFLDSKSKKENVKQRLFNGYEKKCLADISQFQRQLFLDIDLQTTKDINHLNVRFQTAYLVNLLNMIDKKIKKHSQDNRNEFEFLPQYRAMMLVFVSRYVLHVYTEVNKRYDEENSPKAIIEQSRGSTWSFFKNLVDERTHDIIAARLLCEPMKSKIIGTLQQHVAIIIEGRVRAYLEHSKVSLIVKVMEQLATDENFDMYKDYLNSPGSYALRWITNYTNDRFFSTSEYIDIVKDFVGKYIKEFKADIEKAGTECNVKKTERMNTFISSIQTVTIPDHIAKQVREYELNDIDNFLPELEQSLDELQQEIINEHKTTTPRNIKWGKSPYTSIFEGLWGCEKVCPLCKEPCQRNEDHDSTKVPHTCIQHRPEGVIGIHGSVSRKLVIKSCSYLVQSQENAKCGVFQNNCKRYDNCKCQPNDSHPYKNYKLYFPNWDIAPSSDMESSKYWMWFMANFSKDLAKLYSLKEPIIPESWKSISKQNALSSLRVCYEY